MNAYPRSNDNGKNIIILAVIAVVGAVLYAGHVFFSRDIATLEQSQSVLGSAALDSTTSKLGTGLLQQASSAVLNNTHTPTNSVDGQTRKETIQGRLAEEDDIPYSQYGGVTAADSNPQKSGAVAGAAKVSADNNSESNQLASANTQSVRQSQTSNQPEAGQADEQPAYSEDDLPEDSNSISGRVLNDLGEPMSGIELTATSRRLFATVDQTIPQSIQERRTVSDFAGRYRFLDLADGEYEIKTAAIGRYPAAKTVVRTGVDSANLVLTEQWQLTVHGLITGTAGERLEEVRILPGSRGVSPVVSDENGGYEIKLQIKGTRSNYVLRYRRSSYREQTMRIDREEWQDLEHLLLDVVMEPVEAVAAVTGSIQSNRGEPLAGETVSLHSPQHGSRYRASSDQAGRFAISNVEVAEDYRLEVRPRGPYRNYKQKDLAVTAAGTRLDITLEPVNYASVFGQMIDRDGNPIPNLDLWVRGQDAHSTKVQVSGDDQGYFGIDNAPDGALVFETQSFPKLSVMGVNVAAGAEQTVDLVLDWGDYTLQGRVIDNAGLPVAVHRILLTWSHNENGLHSSSLRKTASDAEGNFEFPKLGPGRHKVTIDVPGFERLDEELEVGFGANLIEMVLEKDS